MSGSLLAVEEGRNILFSAWQPQIAPSIPLSGGEPCIPTKRGRVGRELSFPPLGIECEMIEDRGVARKQVDVIQRP